MGWRRRRQQTARTGFDAGYWRCADHRDASLYDHHVRLVDSNPGGLCILLRTNHAAGRQCSYGQSGGAQA